jgi:hypothetical protein
MPPSADAPVAMLTPLNGTGSVNVIDFEGDLLKIKGHARIADASGHMGLNQPTMRTPRLACDRDTAAGTLGP